MNPAALRTLLGRLSHESSPAAAKLAAYLLENPKAASESTILSLAEQAQVSYATVCRLLKRTGFESCRSFKKALSALADDPGEPLSPDETPPVTLGADELIDRICTFTASLSDNCRRTMTADTLDRAVSLICGAGQILIAGLGTSAVTSHYAYTKFFRLGLPCTCETDLILLRMKASLLRQGDLLIAVSSSGRTRTIIETARQAKSSGASVIVLSDYSSSPLSRCADLCVTTTSRDAELSPQVDLPLIQGQLTIIDLFYARLCAAVGANGFEVTEKSVRDEKLNGSQRPE